MSSLSVVTDKSNWAYHLYKIYQQYPDHMLRSVMQKLRAYKMVSIKKHAARSKMPRSTITTASGSTNSGSQGGGANYLPLSSSPYQLSVSFIHKFLSRYRYGGMYFSFLETNLLRMSIGLSPKFSKVLPLAEAVNKRAL